MKARGLPASGPAPGVASHFSADPRCIIAAVTRFCVYLLALFLLRRRAAEVIYVKGHLKMSKLCEAEKVCPCTNG